MPWFKKDSPDEEEKKLEQRMKEAGFELERLQHIAERADQKFADSLNAADGEDTAADAKAEEAKAKGKIAKLENMEKQAVHDMSGDDYAKAMAGMMMAMACRYRIKKLQGKPASLLTEAAIMVGECTPSSPGYDNVASKFARGLTHGAAAPIHLVNGVEDAIGKVGKKVKETFKAATTPTVKAGDQRRLAAARDKLADAKAKLKEHRKEHGTRTPDPGKLPTPKPGGGMN